MTTWGNSGYVMADLGLLRNLQLHAAVSFGFRIVIHQTRTVWLSRYFALRYDGNLSAWLAASINFELLVTQVDSVPQPKCMFLSILCFVCIWLGSYIVSLNEILILLNWYHTLIILQNQSIWKEPCSFTTTIRICLCRGFSWLGVNDSAQFALPVCRVIGII